jgi:hypothetical protein
MSDESRFQLYWQSTLRAVSSIPGTLLTLTISIASGIAIGMAFSPSLGTALVICGFILVSSARRRRSP